MPKKGRRSDRDEALGADLGGLGGDEDYDWIKYLGEGRSSASSSTASASTALQAPPRTITAPPDRPTAPPERPMAPPERRMAQPRRMGRDSDLTDDGDTDPGAGGAFRDGSGRGVGPGSGGRRTAARRSEPAVAPDDSFADYLAGTTRPGRSAPGTDPYAGPAAAVGRGAAAGETARFAAPDDDWGDGGIAAPAAGRPAAGPPTTDQPRRFGRRARGDRPGPAAGDRGAPGDGTGPLRPVGRSSRTEPGGGSDTRGRSGSGQSSGGAVVERRPGSTGPRRAVKVRQGRATDLLFNPAAEDYGQPLYPPGEDPGQSFQAAGPNAAPASPPRPGRPPGDPRTSPQRRLDTAEFAQPLYSDFDSGRATGARSRPAWPDDDPLADTDARGRQTSRTGPQPRVDPLTAPPRSDRTGPQRRVDALGRTDALTGPDRLDRTGPQPRVDRTGPQPRVDPLTAPSRSDRTGPQPRVDRTGPQPRVDPLTAPSRSDRTGPQRRVDALGRTDALTGRDRVGRTGPQRRVDGLGRPDPLTDSGVGVLWPSEPASASVAPETAIANAPGRRTATGPFDRPAFDNPDPLAEPLDRPARAPSSPVRKPRKGGKKAGAARSKSGAGAPKAAKSRARYGRRRKVTMLLGGLVVVVALAAVGYFKLMPTTSHIVSVPATVGSFVKQHANTAESAKQRIMSAARRDVKNVVAAVYQQNKGPGTSNGPQTVVFIGGNLTGSASAGDLISAFVTKLPGAFTTRPGRLGGQAACAPGANGNLAECAWADGDTFGVVVSATMGPKALADEMLQMRPYVEHVVK